MFFSIILAINMGKETIHGKLKIAPTDVHVLIPRSCECFALYGKEDLLDAMQKLELGSRQSGRPDNHKGHCKRVRKGTERKKTM